ncbi:MAG: hypothetical protein LBT40_00425 [Deltaproteobacteria bacterium]|jgi:hypothetical protein|nr:hypothetical protein [Deltaproteobacteria bacterium]
MKWRIGLVRISASGGSRTHTSETVTSDSQETAKEIAVSRQKQRYPKDEIMVEDVKEVK